MTNLRPRLAAALASALADSPTAERLAEVAVECVVAEIGRRIAALPGDSHAASGDPVEYGHCCGVEDALTSLRAALIGSAP